MTRFSDPIALTPRQFELAVKGILDAAAVGLVSYESKHLETFSASDGDYEIDVTARFQALGADFVVLVECKNHKRKIEREDVQILQARVLSVGAHKGMLFSTAGFQSGAIKYAQEHGIALAHLVDGKSTWCTKGAGDPAPLPLGVDIPEFVAWWCHGDSMSVMSEDRGEFTRAALGLSSEP